MGRNLQTKTSVYMSADAGLSWHQVSTFRIIKGTVRLISEWRPIHNSTLKPDKGFKGAVVNRAFASLQRESLGITLKVPLNQFS